jgi:hypothetical protein
MINERKNPYGDRITEILQSRVNQPAQADYAAGEFLRPGESAYYGLRAALGNEPQGVLNAIRGVQDQRRGRMLEGEDRQLGAQKGLYDIFEEQRAAGNKSAEALLNKISMFTDGDPEGTQLFLQALNDDPEEIDPTNAYQVMTKLAQIKKQSGYKSPTQTLEQLKIAQAQRSLSGSGELSFEGYASMTPEERSLYNEYRGKSGGGDLPADIKNFQYYQSLGPEEKKAFENLKRPSSNKGPLELPQVQKQYLESIDVINSADRAASNLEAALDLNKKAIGGAGANIRQGIGRAVGTITGPSEATVATTEFENLVLGQVAENLKATFGAMPTEGERRFLIDLQASIDKTPLERERLLQRGLTLVRDRQKRELDFQQKAIEGTLFESPTPTSPIQNYDDIGLESMTDEDILRALQ